MYIPLNFSIVLDSLQMPVGCAIVVREDRGMWKESSVIHCQSVVSALGPKLTARRHMAEGPLFVGVY